MKLFEVIVQQDGKQIVEDGKRKTEINHIQSIYAANEMQTVWQEATNKLINDDEIISIKEVAPAVFILND